MVREDYDALHKMSEEFRQEISKIEIQLQNNLRRIREKDIYLKSLMGSESDDFKVFSPRKAEVIYKEEIKKIQEEVSGLEGQNQELSRKKDGLSGYVQRLEDILDHNKMNPVVQWKDAGEMRNASIQKLEELVHKIEQSSVFIEKNPIQAKQDYAIIGKHLQEILDKIRETVWMYKGDDLGFEQDQRKG